MAYKTDPPKIKKVLRTITVQECEVEGMPMPVLIIDNKEQVPHKKAISMLVEAARGIESFLQGSN